MVDVWRDRVRWLLVYDNWWHVLTTHLLLYAIGHILVFVDFAALSVLIWIRVKIFEVILQLGSFFSLCCWWMPRHLEFNIAWIFLLLLILMEVVVGSKFNFISRGLWYYVHFGSNYFNVGLFPRGRHRRFRQIVKDRRSLVIRLLLMLKLIKIESWWWPMIYLR